MRSLTYLSDLRCQPHGTRAAEHCTLAAISLEDGSDVPRLRQTAICNDWHVRWKMIAHVAIDVLVGFAMASFVVRSVSSAVHDDGRGLRSFDLLLAVAAACIYITGIRAHLQKHHAGSHDGA